MCRTHPPPITHLYLGPERVGVSLQDALNRRLPHRLVVLVVQAVEAVAAVTVAPTRKALAVAVEEHAAARQHRRDGVRDTHVATGNWLLLRVVQCHTVGQVASTPNVGVSHSQFEALGVLAVAGLAALG